MIERTNPSSHSSRALRVVIGDLGVGGAQRHLELVLPRLQTLGWGPRVLTLMALGPMAKTLNEAGIQTQVLPSSARLLTWPRWLRRSLGLPLLIADLRNEFRRDPVSVTWMLLPEAYLLTMSAALSLRHRPPLVMSRRSLNRYQARFPGMRRFETLLHPRTAATLANSQVVRWELEHLERAPVDRLCLIRNGIDERRFHSSRARSQTRSALGIGAETRVLCIVANLIGYKGHRDLLHGLAAVRAELPAWTLLCVGGGEASELRTLGCTLGLAHNLHWLGTREDIPELLAAADIGILASHEEGSSNAVLECMAAGLPMVATAVGGNQEAVLDGQTGLLVPPHEPLALGRAIARLAHDTTLAKRMGTLGRERVQRLYSLERCISDYNRLFDAVAAGRRPPEALTSLAIRPDHPCQKDG